MVLLCKARPFRDAADNRINILNEVCLLVVYGLLLSLEQINGPAEVIVVWIICGVVGFVNVFSLTIILILKSMECKRKCKERQNRKKELEEFRRKRIFPDLNQSTGQSLFSPLSRAGKAREAKPSTFS